MLERHHLNIIRAVIEHGTLTKAAESLYLSQSALSHTIKKLEEQLGAPLWHKEGRNLRLTQAGERLHRFYARGQSGLLRIGMECHPCYQWLLKTVAPYLQAWPRVDVDVKQQFQFKGASALLAYEVDVLITPDPVQSAGLHFLPVFPYEQVLVVARDHPLSAKSVAQPQDLAHETLLTYPVPVERLDIFQQFLLPAERSVAAHRTLETTEILLQMVAANRGVTALPHWLIREQAAHLPLACLRLGDGIYKHIHLGLRSDERQVDYIDGFIEIAKRVR